MAEIKISDLTPKGVNLAVTDLLVISEDIGGGLYETKSITGDEVLNAVAKTAVAVRNQTGVTIYKGTIVYISGASGGKALISKAQANSEITSSKTLGVVTADIANNANGNVLTNGLLTDLDTRTTATHPFTADTLAIGDDLYLSPTNAGYVTNVKPIAPNNLVNIGKVLETSATTGQILYAIVNGYELGELHDVDTTGAVSGNVLALNGGIWKPTTISTGLTIGTTPITSGTDTRILFQNGGVVSQNAMLTLNDTGVAGSTTANFANTFKRVGNNFEIYGANGVTNMISSEGGGTALNFISTFQNVYTTGNNHNFKIGTGAPVSAMYINSSLNVGIGTTSPAARLDIKAQGALSTDIAFRVRNSANTANLIEQRGNGSLLFSNSTSTYVLNPRTDADGFSLSSGSGLYGTGTGFEVVSNQFVIHNSSVRTFRFSGSSVSNFWVLHNESNQLRICPTTDTTQPTINLNNTNVVIGGLSVGASATKTFAIYSGSAPTTSPVDAFQQYSADITAGNAAPHFRTEDGSVIKLYKQDLPTNPTNAQIATFLSNLGLANLI